MAELLNNILVAVGLKEPAPLTMSEHISVFVADNVEALMILIALAFMIIPAFVFKFMASKAERRIGQSPKSQKDL